METFFLHTRSTEKDIRVFLAKIDLDNSDRPEISKCHVHVSSCRCFRLRNKNDFCNDRLDSLHQTEKENVSSGAPLPGRDEAIVELVVTV